VPGLDTDPCDYRYDAFCRLRQLITSGCVGLYLQVPDLFDERVGCIDLKVLLNTGERKYRSLLDNRSTIRSRYNEDTCGRHVGIPLPQRAGRGPLLLLSRTDQ
jgi:hypothetical protein